MSRSVDDGPPGHARNLVFDPKGYWLASRGEALSYPEHGSALYFSVEDGSAWFRHRNEVIITVMRQFPPAGPLFDIGGGNGYVAAGLERAGFPAVVVEPSLVGAENACRRGLRVICATAEGAEFAPGAIEAMGLFDVLEHVEDDAAFLASLATPLRPGGRIYLSVPAFQLLWSSDDEYAGHCRRYTRASLTRVLRSAGFKIEYLSYFFSFLPLPILLVRTIPSRIGWRENSSRPQTTREQHALGSGRIRRVVEWAMARELAWLSRRRTIPVGGSCIAVARSAG